MEGKPVKLISFYEDQWIAPGADRAYFGQLAKAFGVDWQMIREWSEAEIPEGSSIVVCEQVGSVDLKDFEHPEKAVYVFGRTGHNITNVIPSYDHSLHIPTPRNISLFSIEAASIIMVHRFRLW